MAMVNSQKISSNKLLDLEDFGVLDASRDVTASSKKKEELLTASVKPSLESDSLIITESDLEDIKRKSYQDGINKGKEDTEKEIKENYYNIISSLKESFKEENENRDNKIEFISRKFVETVVDIVRNLLNLDEDSLVGIKNNLFEEAFMFAKTSKNFVKIQCNVKDVEFLQEMIAGYEDIQIETSEECAKGLVRIVSEASTIVINSREWRESVIDKIMTALTALIQQGNEKQGRETEALGSER